jgi:hypothetical protein
VFCFGTVARADSIVSGAISFTGPNDSCAANGTSTGTLDMNCESTRGGEVWASLTGSASPTNVQAEISLGTDNFYYATGSFTVSMDGLYMLTGGEGFGYANWSLWTRNSMGGPGYFGPCSVTVGGVTELCYPEAGYETDSFYVPYNTPLQVDFTGSFDLYSRGQMAGGPGGLSFTLTNLQPFPTPEPPPLGLVGLGLLALSGTFAMRRFAVA